MLKPVIYHTKLKIMEDDLPKIENSSSQNFSEFLPCERANFNIGNAFIYAGSSFYNEAVILKAAAQTIP